MPKKACKWLKWTFDERLRAEGQGPGIFEGPQIHGAPTAPTFLQGPAVPQGGGPVPAELRCRGPVLAVADKIVSGGVFNSGCMLLMFFFSQRLPNANMVFYFCKCLRGLAHVGTFAMLWVSIPSNPPPRGSRLFGRSHQDEAWFQTGDRRCFCFQEILGGPGFAFSFFGLIQGLSQERKQKPAVPTAPGKNVLSSL